MFQRGGRMPVPGYQSSDRLATLPQVPLLSVFCNNITGAQVTQFANYLHTLCKNAEHAVSTRLARQYKVCQLADGPLCCPLPGPCHCLHCTDVTRSTQSHQLVIRLVSTLACVTLALLPRRRSPELGQWGQPGSGLCESQCVSAWGHTLLYTQHTQYNLSLAEEKILTGGKMLQYSKYRIFYRSGTLKNKMSPKFTNIYVNNSL